MKKLLVICNWKMYVGTRDNATVLARAVKKLATKNLWCDMNVVPSFPHISTVASVLKSGEVRVGAQTLSIHDNGAHTGEVSAGMLKDAGASLVIVGHSERRSIGETEDIVHAQVVSARKSGLRVVLCVGESERDPEHGGHFEIISKQVRHALAGLSAKDAVKIVVVYEPLWAIGKSGEEAVPPEVLRETVIFIRKLLVEMFGRIPAVKVPILYGGSVDSVNVESLFKVGGAQGFLIGRASTDAIKFTELLGVLSSGQKLSK